MTLELETVLRQYDLVTENLSRTSRELHDWLGVEQGQTHSFTVELGFANEIMMVGSTILEVVQPIWGVHRHHGILAARGDCALMAVLQAKDCGRLRGDAQAMGVEISKDKIFQEQPVLQFDPKEFGTPFENYEYNRPDGWWSGGDELYRPSTVVQQVLGAEIAVEDPAMAAARLAGVYRLEFDASSGSTVQFGDQSVAFIPSNGGWHGIVALKLKPFDPARRGASKVICGTEFRFV